MTNNQRICKDCRHCKPDYGLWWLPIIGWGFSLVWWLSGNNLIFSRCEAAPISNVLGTKQRFDYCSVAREFDRLCGPAGKLWERK